jgi:hypothetical protein
MAPFWPNGPHGNVFFPANPIFVPVSNTSATTVPINASGIYNIVINAFALTVNGITYATFADNIISNAIATKTLGVGPFLAIPGGFTAGDPLSFTITQTSPSGTGIISHYMVGNQVLYDLYVQNENAVIAYNLANNNPAVLTTNSIMLPYYYQTTNTQNAINVAPKNYLSQFPRSKEWHRLTYDFGTGVFGSSAFSGISAAIDQYKFLNNPNMGFISQMNELSVNHSTIFPKSEFSYFDNAKVSYYDKTSTLPQYRVGQVLAKDWQGSILDQSTALESRVFSRETIPNFHFLVSVLGWSDDLVFIVQDIVEKLKPAYAYASVLFKQEQTLDTTASGNSVLSNPATNWDSGNTMNNIIIKASGSFENLDTDESKPGFITVSPSGNVIFT